MRIRGEKLLTVKFGEIPSWIGEGGGDILYLLDFINNIRRATVTLKQSNDPYLEELFHGKSQDYQPKQIGWRVKI